MTKLKKQKQVNESLNSINVNQQRAGLKFEKPPKPNLQQTREKSQKSHVSNAKVMATENFGYQKEVIPTIFVTPKS